MDMEVEKHIEVSGDDRREDGIQELNGTTEELHKQEKELRTGREDNGDEEIEINTTETETQQTLDNNRQIKEKQVKLLIAGIKRRCNEVKKRRRCEQEEATENVDAELEDENKKEQILMITKSCGKEIEVELVDIREDLNGIQLQEETNDIEEEEELMMLEETIDETRSKNRTTQAMENVEEKEEEAEKKEGMVKKDGLLHYICRRRRRGEHFAKVVTSPEEANDVFVSLHASDQGGHCGMEKTRDAISSRFYWPGMEEDIRKWIAQCPECQARRSTLKEKKAYIPIEITEPLELVGMDLVGKLTPTKQGNQYICVMIDYFTKWTEAYPLKSKSANEVSDCILDFFYKFGAPKRILTDQGKKFVNKINFDLCESLGIKRSLCSPYHPQTNGLVEKMNGTIQRVLTKLVGSNAESWDTHLKATLFALRTKKQLTTQFSPYYLMFGREARYPSEVPDNYEVNDEMVERTVALETLTTGLQDLPKVHKVVLENVEKVREKVRKRKALQGQEDRFEVGDKVLRKNIREEQRKGGKMGSAMLGPFTVVHIQGKSVDLVSAKGKALVKIVNAYLTSLVGQYTTGSKRGFVVDSYQVAAMWQGSQKGL
ncbi:gag-pol fusion [Labeo rohita]|uniref:Gypsy retrotransposon integrase-like protein 1 n=1 Tax=Labeo rohita TaxID=84645 RepID=A0A498P0T3_LABRO|nr:gag-pol fusion [Labeo rohita]